MRAYGRIMLAFFFLVVAAGITRARQDAVTDIRLTDEVLLEDAIRLGINTCGDSYWDSAITKVRVAENFEGVMYRMISWGPQQDEQGIFVWFSPPEDAWHAMKGKVRYTLLGGPAKGTTGVIKDIQKRVCPSDHQKRTLTYLVFDRELPASEHNKNGILLEYGNPEQGSIRETNNPDFWGSVHNDVAIGDVPPGSFGVAALRLRGSQEQAHYTFVPMWQRVVRQDGTWRVRFWTKADAGEPSLRVTADHAETVELQPGDEWRQHDLTMEVRDFPEGQNGIAVRFVADGGDVLVDDVEIWKEENHTNPTAFRDQLVDLVRKLNPGTLRHLQMGGSDLENNLRPRLEQMGWTRNFGNLVKGGRNGASKYDFNLHDYYGLCEYVGADPWYCLPGTLHPEEIPKLVEYLAAPPDVGYGKRRAELGHPTPWTDVFDHIYIEFGNEAWNPGGYATGSFNGPDHWKDMIEVAKDSPYNDPNIVFVAGMQAGSPWLTGRILEDVPNAELYAIAPYLMNGTRNEYVAHLESDDELFRWVYAYTIRRVMEPVGKVYNHHQKTGEAGKELAIYEHNFHITHPWPDEGGVPIEKRNRINASIGGGINIINDALMMMRERRIRTQCQFNLNQKNFFHGVKLWGFVPGLNRDQRYRPTFLAEKIANDIIGGDIVRTVHSGARPTFSATGHFEDERDSVQTYEGVPTLWSYAFREDNRRGLILFNLDTQQSHRVSVSFPGQVSGAGATAQWLTADRIAANNEYETGEPQVEIRREQMGGFHSGTTLELPPFSMVGIEWQVE